VVDVHDRGGAYDVYVVYPDGSGEIQTRTKEFDHDDPTYPNRPYAGEVTETKPLEVQVFDESDEEFVVNPDGGSDDGGSGGEDSGSEDPAGDGTEGGLTTFGTDYGNQGYDPRPGHSDAKDCDAPQGCATGSQGSGDDTGDDSVGESNSTTDSSGDESGDGESGDGETDAGSGDPPPEEEGDGAAGDCAQPNAATSGDMENCDDGQAAARDAAAAKLAECMKIGFQSAECADKGGRFGNSGAGAINPNPMAEGPAQGSITISDHFRALCEAQGLVADYGPDGGPVCAPGALDPSRALVDPGNIDPARSRGPSGQTQ